LLADLGHDLPLLAINRNISEQRSRRIVPVPDIVMNRLEMPNDAACPGIEADNAGGVEIISWAVAAVVIARCCLGREI
jgi:hypothetical protein